MEALKEAFQKIYGTRPGIVRAPGRVNLIGEHTDYNGLPVCPMAIGREIKLAFAPREDNWIEIQNINQDFPLRRFQAAHQITPFDQGDWGNYVKAAVNGIIKHEKLEQPRGMNILASGNIPIASGLSSSTALVVASALAFLVCNNIAWEPSSLADLLTRAEKFVGTEGGGMDQAAILLAKPDHALRIDFFPLRTRHVKLPEGYEILVTKSMIAAPKTARAQQMYNRRPMECRLAHAMLKKALEAHFAEKIDSRRLGDLSMFWRQRKGEVEGLVAFSKELLGEGNWSLERISAFLELDSAFVSEKYLMLTDGSIFPEPEDGFALLPRLRHVLSEGERVRRAGKALAAQDANAFGQLMDESHSSCRDDYQISCRELDELVRLAREGGAQGARLTGAGFGGCTVSLVPEKLVSQCIETIYQGYYQGFLKQNHPELYEQLGDLDDYCFLCRPEAGASLVSQL